MRSVTSLGSLLPLAVMGLLSTGCFQTEYPSACELDAAACEGSEGDSAADETSDDALVDETLDASTDDTESDSATGADDGIDTDMPADGAVEVGGDTAIDGTIDTTVVDTGTDTKVVDTGTDTKIADSGVDTTVVDTGAADTRPDVAVDTAPACVASSYLCAGNELRQCKSDGTGYTSVVTCPVGTCSAAAGRCTFCTPGALGCSGAQPTKCDALGTAFVANGAACVAPQTCGGGGTAGVCGCTPTPTATLCAGKECGSVANGCGGTVSCGSCTGAKTCGGGGTANRCGGCGGSLPGPTMIDAGGFCIDSTEVTQAQYQAFLTAKGTDFSGQPTMCAARPYAIGGGPGCTWSPTTTPTLPVVCVDWCKAHAYCKWAGKRLCGKIGGGATPLADYATTTVDQWHKACTVNGSVFWPYGSSPQSTACVTDGARTSPATVKSKSTCVGPFSPFDGLYDMSGNVAEWTDSCGIASSGGYAGEMVCRVRGGSYDSTTYQTACDADLAVPWAFSGDVFGIRCCAD